MALAVAALPAAAMTIPVTRHDDPDPPPCTPTDCSLRGAVILANSSAGADLVTLKPGVYSLTIAGNGEDFAASGDLDVREALTIEGVGPTQTLVRMTGQLDRVFDLINTLQPDPGSTLRALTVADGYAAVSGPWFESASGGCLRSGRPLHLDNVTVRGCQALFSGGAISGVAGNWQHVAIEGNTAPGVGGASISVGPGMTIDDLVVLDNVSTATQVNTGAPDVPPYAVGGLAATIHPAASVQRVVLTKNRAKWCGGGRVFFLDGATTLARWTVSDNLALEDGGGLCLSNFYSDIEIELRDFLVVDNHADRHAGGIDILHFENAGGPQHPYSVRVVDSVIEGNSAGTATGAGNGGGIRFVPCPSCSGAQGQSLALVDSRLAYNAALSGGTGGGIFSGRPVSLLRTRVTGNSAGDGGGGMRLYNGAGGYSSVADSTLDANTAVGHGGAIDLSGLTPAPLFALSMQVRNSTFEGNVAQQGGALYTSETRARLANVTLRAGAVNPPGAQGSLAYTAGGVPGRVSFVNSLLVGTCAGAAPTAAVGDMQTPGNSCNLTGSSFPNLSPAWLALGPLQDNGGATPTIRPGNGSIALDHGDNAQCQAYDQRGWTRPRTAANPCDVGAVEVNGLPPP